MCVCVCEERVCKPISVCVRERIKKTVHQSEQYTAAVDTIIFLAEDGPGALSQTGPGTPSHSSALCTLNSPGCTAVQLQSQGGPGLTASYCPTLDILNRVGLDC